MQPNFFYPETIQELLDMLYSEAQHSCPEDAIFHFQGNEFELIATYYQHPQEFHISKKYPKAVFSLVPGNFSDTFDIFCYPVLYGGVFSNDEAICLRGLPNTLAEDICIALDY